MAKKYKMIPVEEDVYDRILVLCEAYEFPQRSQGALVAKLVNGEYDKLNAMKLLPKGKTVKAAETPKGA